jgi:hypothetical protein
MKSRFVTPLLCTALIFGGAAALAQSESHSTDERSSSSSITTTTHSSTTRAAGSRGDFDHLDVSKHGYLTSEDVKGDGWLKSNFTRCNVKGDGRMSWDEYSNCRE